MIMAWFVAAAASSTHDALRTWATTRGCAFGTVEIAASSLGCGVGMFATAEIDQGEMLFAVPRRLNVGLAAALSDAECGSEFEAEADEGGAMSALCAFIAKQHLCSTSPYLATLPELSAATSNQVQHWASDEVEGLAGTAAYTQACQVRFEAEEAVKFALGLPSLRQCVVRAVSARDSTADVDALIAETVRGAHAAVLSRSFALEDDDPGAREHLTRDTVLYSFISLSHSLPTN